MNKSEVKSRKFCETDDYITMEYLLKREGSQLSDSHIPIIRRLITIGRSPNCTITLKSIRVSRMQCEIIYSDENIFLRDTQSSNGTFLNNEKLTNEMRKLKVGDYIGFGVNPFPRRCYDSNQFVFSLQRYQSEQSVEIADDDNADGKSLCDNMDHTYNLDPVDNLTLKNQESDDFTTQYEFKFSDEEVQPKASNIPIKIDSKYEKPNRDSLLSIFNDSNDASDDKDSRSCDYTSHSEFENKGLSAGRCETEGKKLCDAKNEDLGSKSSNFTKTRSLSTSDPKSESTLSKKYKSPLKMDAELIEMIQKPTKLETIKLKQHELMSSDKSDQNLNGNENLNSERTNIKNITSNTSIITSSFENIIQGVPPPDLQTQSSKFDIESKHLLPKNSSAGSITSKLLRKPSNVEVIHRLSIDCQMQSRKTYSQQTSKDYANLASNLRNITSKIQKILPKNEDFHKNSTESSLNLSKSMISTQTQKPETMTSGSLAQSSQIVPNIQQSTVDVKSAPTDVYGTFETNSETNKINLDYYNNVTDNEDESEFISRIMAKRPEIIAKKASIDKLPQLTAAGSTVNNSTLPSNDVNSVLALESQKEPLINYYIQPQDKHSQILAPKNQPETKQDSKYSDKVEPINFNDRTQKAIQSVMKMAEKIKSTQYQNPEPSLVLTNQQNNPNLVPEARNNATLGSKMLRDLLLRASIDEPHNELKEDSIRTPQLQHNVVGSTSYEMGNIKQFGQHKSTEKQQSCLSQQNQDKIQPKSLSIHRNVPQMSQGHPINSTRIQKVEHTPQGCMTTKPLTLKKSDPPKQLKHVKHTSKPSRVRRTEAEINRDLELYSKMLASKNEKTKNAPQKLRKLAPKSELLDINSKVPKCINKPTQFIVLQSQPMLIPNQYPKIDTQKSIESSADQQSSTKKNKLSSTDVDEIKEIVLKAVYNKIINKDQEVVQEIERKITNVLKSVAVSDDEDEGILDEISGVFVKKDKNKKIGDERSSSVEVVDKSGKDIPKVVKPLGNEQENQPSCSNLPNNSAKTPQDQNPSSVEVQSQLTKTILETQPTIPNITSIKTTVSSNPPEITTVSCPTVLNIQPNIPTRAMSYHPNFITTVPILLGNPTLPQNHVYNTAPPFPTVYTAPVAHNMANSNAILIRSTPTDNPNMNTVSQFGPGIHNQRSVISYAHSPATQNLVNLAQNAVNYTQGLANYSQIYRQNQPIISRHMYANYSSVLNPSPQILNQYPQKCQVYQHPPKLTPISSMNNFSQIRQPEREEQPISSQITAAEDSNHNSVQETTEEVTLMNLEPAKRTLSITNLLETSKMILMNNNADSDSLYATAMDEILFPQNVDDVSSQNASVCLQKTDDSDDCFKSNTRNLILNDKSTAAANNINPEVETSKNYEQIEESDEIIDITNDSETNVDDTHNDNLSDNNIRCETKSTIVSQSDSVTSSNSIDNDNHENTTTDQMLSITQDNVEIPKNVDCTISDTQEEDAQKSDTINSNKVTSKEDNIMNSIVSNDNSQNVSSVEVEEDIQSCDDSESVINSKLAIVNKIGDIIEGLESSDDEKAKKSAKEVQKLSTRALDSFMSQISTTSSINSQSNYISFQNKKCQMSAPESVAETDLDQLEVSSFGSYNDQEEITMNCEDFQDNFKVPQPLSQPISPESSRSSRSKVVKSNVNSRSSQLLALKPTVRRSRRSCKFSKNVIKKLTNLEELRNKIELIEDIMQKDELLEEKAKKAQKTCKKHVEDQIQKVRKELSKEEEKSKKLQKPQNIVEAAQKLESSKDKLKESEESSKTKISKTQKKNQAKSTMNLESTRRSLRTRSNVKKSEIPNTDIQSNHKSFNDNKHEIESNKDQSETSDAILKSNDKNCQPENPSKVIQSTPNKVNKKAENLNTSQLIKTSNPEKKDHRLRRAEKPNEDLLSSKVNKSFQSLTKETETEISGQKPNFLDSLLLDSLDILSNELIENHKKSDNLSIHQNLSATVHVVSSNNKTLKNLPKSKSSEEITAKHHKELITSSVERTRALRRSRSFNREDKQSQIVKNSTEKVEPQRTKNSSKNNNQEKSIKHHQNSAELSADVKTLNRSQNIQTIQQNSPRDPKNRSKTRSSERLTTKSPKFTTEAKLLPKTKSFDSIVDQKSKIAHNLRKPDSSGYIEVNKSTEANNLNIKESSKPSSINVSNLSTKQSPKVNKSIQSEQSTVKNQVTIERTTKNNKKCENQETFEKIINEVKIPLNDTTQSASDDKQPARKILRSRSKSVDLREINKQTKSKLFNKFDIASTPETQPAASINGYDVDLLRTDKIISKEIVLDKITAEQTKADKTDKLKATKSPRVNPQANKVNTTDESVRNLRNRPVPVNSSLSFESVKKSDTLLSLPNKSTSQNNQKDSNHRSKSAEPSSQNTDHESVNTSNTTTASSSLLKGKIEEKSVRSLRNRVVPQVEATNPLKSAVCEKEKLIETKDTKAAQLDEVKLKVKSNSDLDQHDNIPESTNNSKSTQNDKSSHFESSNQSKPSHTESLKETSSNLTKSSDSPAKSLKPSFSSVFLPPSANKLITKPEKLQSNQEKDETLLRRLRDRPKTHQGINLSSVQPNQSNVPEFITKIKPKHQNEAQQAKENESSQKSPETINPTNNANKVKNANNPDNVEPNKKINNSPINSKQILENAITNKLLTINLTSLRSRAKSIDSPKLLESIKLQKSLKEPSTQSPLIKRTLASQATDNLEILKKLSIRPRKNENVSINKTSQPVKSIREQLLESQRRSRSSENTKQIDVPSISENDALKDQQLVKSSKVNDQNCLAKSGLSLETAEKNKLEHKEVKVQDISKITKIGATKVKDQLNVKESEEKIENSSAKVIAGPEDTYKSVASPALISTRHQTRSSKKIKESEPQKELNNSENSGGSSLDETKSTNPEDPQLNVPPCPKTTPKSATKQMKNNKNSIKPQEDIKKVEAKQQEHASIIKTTKDSQESAQKPKIHQELKECFVSLQRLTSEEISKFTERSRSLSISTRRSSRSSMSSPDRPLSRKSSLSSEIIMDKRICELKSSLSRRSSSDSNSDIVPLINLVHRPNLRSPNSKELSPNKNVKDAPLSASVRTLLRQISDEKASSTESLPNPTRRNLFGNIEKSKIPESSDDSDCVLQKYVKKLKEEKSAGIQDNIKRPTRSRLSRTKTTSEAEISGSLNAKPEESAKKLNKSEKTAKTPQKLNQNLIKKSNNSKKLKCNNAKTPVLPKQENLPINQSKSSEIDQIQPESIKPSKNDLQDEILLHIEPETATTSEVNEITDVEISDLNGLADKSNTVNSLEQQENEESETNAFLIESKCHQSDKLSNYQSQIEQQTVDLSESLELEGGEIPSNDKQLDSVTETSSQKIELTSVLEINPEKSEGDLRETDDEDKTVDTIGKATDDRMDVNPNQVSKGLSTISASVNLREQDPKPLVLTLFDAAISIDDKLIESESKLSPPNDKDLSETTQLNILESENSEELKSATELSTNLQEKEENSQKSDIQISNDKDVTPTLKDSKSIDSQNILVSSENNNQPPSTSKSKSSKQMPGLVKLPSDSQVSSSTHNRGAETSPIKNEETPHIKRVEKSKLSRNLRSSGSIAEDKRPSSDALFESKKTSTLRTSSLSLQRSRLDKNDSKTYKLRFPRSKQSSSTSSNETKCYTRRLSHSQEKPSSDRNISLNIDSWSSKKRRHSTYERRKSTSEQDKPKSMSRKLSVDHLPSRYNTRSLSFILTSDKLTTPIKKSKYRKDAEKMKMDAKKIISDEVNLLCRPSMILREPPKKLPKEIMDVDALSRILLSNQSIESSNLSTTQKSTTLNESETEKTEFPTQNDSINTKPSTIETSEEHNTETETSTPTLDSSKLSSVQPISSIELMSEATKLISMSQKLLDSLKEDINLSSVEQNNQIKNLPDSTMVKQLLESKRQGTKLCHNLALTPTDTKSLSNQNLMFEHERSRYENISLAHEDPQLDLRSNEEILNNKTENSKDENLLMEVDDNSKELNLSQEHKKIDQNLSIEANKQQVNVLAKNFVISRRRSLRSETRKLSPHEIINKDDHQSDKQQENLLTDQNSCKTEILQENSLETSEKSKSEAHLQEPLDSEVQSSKPSTEFEPKNTIIQQNDSISSTIIPEQPQNINSSSESAASKDQSSIKPQRTSLRLEQKNSHLNENPTKKVKTDNKSDPKELHDNQAILSQRTDEPKSEISLSSKQIITSESTTQELPKTESNRKNIHNLRSRLQKRLKDGQRSFSESSGLNRSANLRPKSSTMTFQPSTSDESLVISQKSPEKSELISNKSSQPTSSSSLSIMQHDEPQHYGKTDTKTSVPTHVYGNSNNKCSETIDEFTQKWKEVDDLIKMEKEKITKIGTKEIEMDINNEEEAVNKDEVVNVAETECFDEQTETIDSVADENEAVLKAIDEQQKVIVLSVETVNISPRKIDEILGNLKERSKSFEDESVEIADDASSYKDKIDDDLMQADKDCSKELNHSLREYDEVLKIINTTAVEELTSQIINPELIDSKSYELPQNLITNLDDDHLEGITNGKLLIDESESIETNQEHEPLKSDQEVSKSSTPDQSNVTQLVEYVPNIQQTSSLSLSNNKIKEDFKKPLEQQVKVIEPSRAEQEDNTSLMKFYTQLSFGSDNLDDHDGNLVIEEPDKIKSRTSKEPSTNTKEDDANTQKIEVDLKNLIDFPSTLVLESPTTHTSKSTKLDLHSHHKSKKANWTAIPTGPSSIKITKTSFSSFKEGEKLAKSRRNSTLPSDAPGVFKKIDSSKGIQRCFSLPDPVTPKSETRYSIKTRRSSTLDEPGNSKEILVFSKDHSHETTLEDQETPERSHISVKHHKSKHITRVHKISAHHFKHKETHQSKPKKRLRSKVIARYAELVRSQALNQSEKLKDNDNTMIMKIVKDISAETTEMIMSAKSSIKEMIKDPNYKYGQSVRNVRKDPIITRLRSVSLDSRQVELNDQKLTHFQNREAEWYRDSDFDSFDDDADIKQRKKLGAKLRTLKKLTKKSSDLSEPSPVVLQPLTQSSPQKHHSVQIIDNFGNVITTLDVYRQMLVEKLPAVGQKKRFIFQDGSEVVMDEAGNVRKNSESLYKVDDPEIIDLDDIFDDPKSPSIENRSQIEPVITNVQENQKFVHPDGDLEHLLTDKVEMTPNTATNNQSSQKSTFMANSRLGSLQTALPSSTKIPLNQASDYIIREHLSALQNNFKMPQNVNSQQNKDIVPHPILDPATDHPKLLGNRSSMLNEDNQRKRRVVSQTVTSNQMELQSNIAQRSLAKELLMYKLKKKLKTVHKMQQIEQTPLIQTQPQDSSDDSEYDNLPELLEIDDTLTEDELEFVLNNRLRNTISCNEMIDKIENLLIKITGTEKILQSPDRENLEQQVLNLEDQEICQLAEQLPSSLGFSSLEEVLKTITMNLEEENKEEGHKQAEQLIPQQSQSPQNKTVIQPKDNRLKSKTSKQISKKPLVRIFRVTDVNSSEDHQNPEGDQQHIIIVPGSHQTNVPQFLPIPVQGTNVSKGLIQQPGVSQFTMVNDQNQIIKDNQPQIQNSKVVQDVRTNHGKDIRNTQSKLNVQKTADGTHGIQTSELRGYQNLSTHQNQPRASEILHAGYTNPSLQQLNLNPQFVAHQQQQQQMQMHFRNHAQYLNNIQRIPLIQQSNQPTQIATQRLQIPQNDTQSSQRVSQESYMYHQYVNQEQSRLRQQHLNSSQGYYIQGNMSRESQVVNHMFQQNSNHFRNINQISQNVNQLPQIHPKPTRNIGDQPRGLTVLSSESINQKIDLLFRQAQQQNGTSVLVPNIHQFNNNIQTAEASSSKLNQVQESSTLAEVQNSTSNSHHSLTTSDKVQSTLQPTDSMSFSKSLQAIAQNVCNKDRLDQEEVIVLDDSLEEEQVLLPAEAITNDTIPQLIPLEAVTPTQIDPEPSSQNKVIKQVTKRKIIHNNFQNTQEKIHRPVPPLAVIPNDQVKLDEDFLLDELRTLEAPIVDVDLSGILNDVAQAKTKPVPAKKKRGRPPAKKEFNATTKINKIPKKRGRKPGWKSPKNTLANSQQASLIDPSENSHQMDKDCKLEEECEVHNEQSYRTLDLPPQSSTLQSTLKENIKYEAEVEIQPNKPEERTTVTAKVDQTEELDNISETGSLAETEHLSDVDEENVDEISATVNEELVLAKQTDLLEQTKNDHILTENVEVVERQQSNKLEFDENEDTDMYRVPITASTSNNQVDPDSPTKSYNQISTADQTEEVEQYSVEDQSFNSDQISSEDQTNYSSTSIEQYQDQDNDNLSDNEHITPFYPEFPEACVVIERLTDEEIALAMSSIKRLESSSIYENFANTYSDILDSKGISEKLTPEAIKRKRSASFDEERMIPKRSQIAVKSTFSSSAVKTISNVENQQQIERKSDSSSEESDSSPSTSQQIKRRRIGPEHYYEDPDYSPAGPSNWKPEAKNTHQIVRPSDLDKFLHRDSDDDDDEDDEMEYYGSDAYGTRIPTVSKMSQRNYKNYLSTIRAKESPLTNYIELSDEEAEDDAQLKPNDYDVDSQPRYNDENDVDAYSKSDDERIVKMPIVNNNNLIPKEKSILSKKSKKSEKRKVSFYNSVFVRTFLSEDE